MSGLREGCAFAQSGCSRIKDLWNSETRESKGLIDLGMSHHPSNRQCRDIITSNIIWRPDEYDCHIRARDWIANPTPNSGNLLDWVYLVLELTRDKALVIELKKTTPNGRIQATAL
jgi:hypothetical protein